MIDYFVLLQASQIITLVEEGDRRCGAPGAAEPMEAPDRPLERIPHIDSSDSEEDDDDLPPSHPPPPPPGMRFYPYTYIIFCEGYAGSITIKPLIRADCSGKDLLHDKIMRIMTMLLANNQNCIFFVQAPQRLI